MDLHRRVGGRTDPENAGLTLDLIRSGKHLRPGPMGPGSRQGPACVSEVGSADVGAAEVSATEVGLAQVCAVEARAPQVGGS